MENGSSRSIGSLFRAVVFGRNPKWTLVRIVVLIVAVLITARYILLPIRVEGPSMLPTYGRGINFVNALAYVGSAPQRGDVVSIRTAGRSIMYMKRIVALPGESVEFRGGRIFINGELLDEPYLVLPSDWDREPVVLGMGEYFVVGDNRSMAMDLHYFGKVSRNRIVGRILLCKNLFASWVR